MLLVIPAGMPESSHMDVKLWLGFMLNLSTRVTKSLPSLALDSGIHAGMTAFLVSSGLMYNAVRGEWERGKPLN